MGLLVPTRVTPLDMPESVLVRKGLLTEADTRAYLSSAELAAVAALMGRIPTMADPYDGSSRVPINLPTLRSKVTNSCPASLLSARIMQSAKSAPAVR